VFGDVHLNMCGILGYVGKQAAVDEQRFTAALDTIRHRGPDDAGVYCDETAGGIRVFLGHRRLSILDLSSLGHQPMASERSGAQIIFNGEIYNYQDIRLELIQLGYTFRSSCDTEVLLAAYDEWGDQCVSRVNGMFAFAIYSPKEQRIFLARDRIGIKPLYYRLHDQDFAFASELTAILRLPIGRAALNRAALADYFAFGYLPRSLTALDHHFKLRPAHTLMYDLRRGSVKIAQYWDALAAYELPEWDHDEEQLAEEFERLATAAVRRRLISDVPLGAFLSGGIDSSLVTALMCKESREKVKTFTIGFSAREQDEAPYARRIAQSLGTDHCDQYVSPEGLERALVEAASLYDEPFADSSAIPTMVLSAMTRKHVTVALSGDGGDELFYGYTRYRNAEIYRRVLAMPRPLRWGAAQLVRLLPGYRPGMWAYVLDSADGAEMYSRIVANRQKDLIAGGGGGLVGEETAREVLSRLGMRQWKKVPPATDLLSFIPEDLLTKVDRASMAVALEVRVPLLDHHVVEFCARVPQSLKFRGGRSKYLMRKVLGKHVPRDLFERPKCGFGIPVAKWFRRELRPWVEGELLSSWAWTVDVINRKRVEQLIADHMSCRANCAPIIWACICWKRWAERVGVI